MQAHFGPDLVSPEWRGSVVTIGGFDGVHRGHQTLLAKAVEEGRRLELPVVVVTFDRHPLAALNPSEAPQPIASLSQKLKWLAEAGAASAVVLAFTRELAGQTATSFLEDFLIDQLKGVRFVVGHDFAFGRGREGTAEWLAARADALILEPVEECGLRVSSSAVRDLILAGDMEKAAKLLSRPFEIEGAIVSGQKLGRTIGYPTINLARSGSQITPPHGIYAGRVICTKGEFMAAASIGVRPTVDGVGRTIEAYLLDYPGGEIYGESATLQIQKRLRGEEKFASLKELTEQIARDVEACRMVLA